MNEPIVSVIMPAYNSEKYIDESIKSIISQSFTKWELIIVDDGSDDSTSEVVKKFLDSDNRIMLIKLKQNKGSANAKNIGISKARGDYIAIMDADDIMCENRLSLQVSAFERYPDVDIVCGNVITVNNNGELLYYSPKFDAEPKNVINGTIMVRRKKMLEYRTKFVTSHDYDLFLRMKSNGYNFMLIREYLIKYRLHGGSIVHQNIMRKYLLAQLAEAFFEQREEKGTDDYENFNFSKHIQIEPKDDLLDFLIYVIDNKYSIGDKSYKRDIKRYFFHSKKIKFRFILYLLNLNSVIKTIRLLKYKVKEAK